MTGTALVELLPGPITFHTFEEYMSTQLKVYNGDRKTMAVEVDARIRSNARHFVQFGIDLMMMRDGQLYKDLPGCNDKSFEEYVDSVEELSVGYARSVIKASLLYQAIEKGSPKETPLALPATEKQCRALIDAALPVWKVKKDKVVTKTGEPRTVEQPIAVSNTEKVVASWEKVIKAHEKYKAKFVKENPGKRPKKISYTFIREQFPGGKPIQRGKGTTMFDCLGRNLSKWTDTLQAYRKKYKDSLPALIEGEKWTEGHLDSMHSMFVDLWTELNEWIEGMVKND